VLFVTLEQVRKLLKDFWSITMTMKID
jgi:hypothetical protein